MCKDEGNTKAKFYFDIVASRSYVTEKNFFHLSGVFFIKHSKIVSYFAFLILLISILPSIKTVLIKIQFAHFISLNMTIVLCLQIENLDCNKILSSISELYNSTISCVKNNDQ